MRDLPLTFAASDGWTRAGVVRAATSRSISIALNGIWPGAAVMVDRTGMPPLAAEVVSVDGDIATCAPIEDADGVVPGARATASLGRQASYVGASSLGHVVDAWGRFKDAQPHAGGAVARSWLSSGAPSLDERSPVNRRLRTGIAAIDAFATIGYGQRVALFAGAGVGKTSLLRSIASRACVDARIVALVGERGREATELIESLRGAPGWDATTVVCATADAPPLERIAAARTATLQAETLACEGRDVLLVVDSLTRVATAWREIALAAGEPPAHRGHPPSLARVIAELVERAGARRTGSITAIYAVLVDGDDMTEPVTDTVRALLDGHVMLSRSLADSGRYPAIDVLRSLSRCMRDIVDTSHASDASTVRRAIAALERAEDLFAIGAYERGGDAQLDAAVDARDAIERLRFSAAAAVDPIAALHAIAETLRETR